MTIVHQIWAIYWSLPLTILVSLVAITSKLILVEFKRYSKSSIQHYNTWQHYPLWTLHTTHITTLPNVNTAYYPLWTLHTTHCEHCILPIMNTAYYPLWTPHTTHITTLPIVNTAYYPLWTLHTTHCEHCILTIVNTVYYWFEHCILSIWQHYPMRILHTTHCEQCLLIDSSSMVGIGEICCSF